MASHVKGIVFLRESYMAYTLYARKEMTSPKQETRSLTEVGIYGEQTALL